MPTLLEFLIARYPAAKRQTFKRMLLDRRIRINGKPPRNLKQEIAADDAVQVLDRGAERKQTHALPFEIVHEDADVLIIDKPAGLLTSTGPREKRPTAWAAVQEYLAVTDPRARPGLIHRLDRDASGLLVFSKNPDAYRELKTQFFHHTVTRAYAAVTRGRIAPAVGRIETYLMERADGTVYSAKPEQRVGQRAITDYETIEASKAFSLLRISLLTGRKHQIRVHLSERGYPIVGDPVYGPQPAEGPLMLTAVELEFDHPRTKQRVKYQKEIPAGMRALFASPSALTHE